MNAFQFDKGERKKITIVLTCSFKEVSGGDRENRSAQRPRLHLQYLRRGRGKYSGYMNHVQPYFFSYFVHVLNGSGTSTPILIINEYDSAITML